MTPKEPKKAKNYQSLIFCWKFGVTICHFFDSSSSPLFSHLSLSLFSNTLFLSHSHSHTHTHSLSPTLSHFLSLSLTPHTLDVIRSQYLASNGHCNTAGCNQHVLKWLPNFVSLILRERRSKKGSQILMWISCYIFLGFEADDHNIVRAWRFDNWVFMKMLEEVKLTLHFGKYKWFWTVKSSFLGTTNL